jgi:ribosomal-protein-alanine N-acetyltransferase
MASAAMHVIIDADAGAIDSVMAVMETAFDPGFGEAWQREQCLGIMGLPGVWLTLGLCDDQVKGFTLSRIIADEAELLLIATVPEIRKQGLGALLLENVINNAALRGASRLHLEVREGNPASGLYQRFGFVPVGRRRAYYKGKFGQSFDALTLTMMLEDI